MGFLDNLENDLKALEGRETFADPAQEQRRREAERERALAIAPYAERLKSGPFTDALLGQATQAGFRVRTKVNFTWLDGALRLEARGRRLELRPTAEGVIAVLFEDNAERATQPVDLDGDPAALVKLLLEAS